MTPPEVPPSLPPPPQQVYLPAYEASRTSGAAVASLICGAIGFLGCCCCPAFAGSIAAIICGHIALINTARDPFLQGRGMAIAGLIMGYLVLVVYGLLMLSSLLNPELYKRIQDSVDKAKQEIRQPEKKDLPADAI